MNWTRALETCEPHAFSFVAVDAFRRMRHDGFGVTMEAFLDHVSRILAARGLSESEQLAALLPLAHELSEGSVHVVSDLIAPLLRTIRSDGQWATEDDDLLLSYGYRAVTPGEPEAAIAEEPQDGQPVGQAPADAARREVIDTVTFVDEKRPASGIADTVVVVVALDEEFDAFSSLADGSIQLGDPASRKFRRLRSEAGTVVLVGVGDRGTISTALATQWAIEKWEPSLLMLAGIAGGFASTRPDYELGDIVLPPQVIGYELAKITDTEVRRRLKIMRSGAKALNTAHQVARAGAWVGSIDVPDPERPDRVPLVHLGDVASGDKVVASTATVAEMRTLWSDVIATEMEGAGLALAAFASASAPEILLAKSICDWADSSKGDLYHPRSSAVAAAYAYGVALQWVADAPLAGRTRPSLRTVRIDGLVKNALIDRLDEGGLERLSNVVGIPRSDRRLWRPGLEAAGIVEWMEARGKAQELPARLLDIDRPDLALLFYEDSDEVVRAMSRTSDA